MKSWFPRRRGDRPALKAYYVAKTTLADGSREALVASKYRSKYRVRSDLWIDDYIGHSSTRELAARAYQIIGHDLYGKPTLMRMLRDDPELAHFAIGFLLRFDP